VLIFELFPFFMGIVSAIVLIVLIVQNLSNDKES
jgi:hypothetical protein